MQGYNLTREQLIEKLQELLALMHDDGSPPLGVVLMQRPSDAIRGLEERTMAILSRPIIQNIVDELSKVWAMGLKLFIAALALILLLAIASQVYRARCQSMPWFDRWATITSGPHKGRAGRVVSWWPFDLVVEINTEATKAEKQRWMQNCRRLGQADEEWIQETGSWLRSWPRVWRWQASIYSASNRKQ